MELKAENINKSYKGRQVVKGVSLEVKKGEIVGLLGPNGAGKTTSFYMIVGMIKPNGGTIFLDNEEITEDAMYKRSQKGIGYLAQEASVFRKLSVEDNIMSVLEFTDRTKEQRKNRLEELIEEFSLGHVRKNRGDLLSGGERRRTEIARCLASDPKFILLDEPFAGVYPIAVEDIQGIVAQLKNKNIGILITDHDVQATLAQVTVISLIESINFLNLSNENIYLCGGGVHNDFLCSEINKQSKAKVRTTLELGIDPDYVEAICFGWLAKQRIENKSFDLSKITGSKGEVYLGRIFEPSK